MFNKKLWLGLTSIFSSLLALVLCVTSLAYNYAGAINATLGITSLRSRTYSIGLKATTMIRLQTLLRRRK